MPERPFSPEFVIEQAGHFRHGHAERTHQVEQHAGIELAAARSHRQTVKGGEAHAAVDADAVADRAHAGAVAEMRHHDFAMRDVGRHLQQPPRDIFI